MKNVLCVYSYGHALQLKILTLLRLTLFETSEKEPCREGNGMHLSNFLTQKELDYAIVPFNAVSFCYLDCFFRKIG